MSYRRSSLGSQCSFFSASETNVIVTYGNLCSFIDHERTSSFSERMILAKVSFCLVSWVSLLHTDALLKTKFDIKPGFRSDNVTLESISAPSQIRCAAACAREPICYGYNYHYAALDQCQLLCGVGAEAPQIRWTVGHIQENVGRNHSCRA